MMDKEQEFHAYRGEPAKRSNGYCTPDDDGAASFHQYDQQAAWTLDVYHDKHVRAVGKLGAKPLPCTHGDGKLFAVTAQQLIEFIAADAGLNVEFRKRKKRQLSDEQKAELTERMKRINAQRNGVLI